MAAGRRQQSPSSKQNYSNFSDEALVDAVRRGTDGAIDEFIVRFHRLLVDRGRRAGFWGADSLEEHVLEVLEDVGTRLVEGRLELSESIAKYLFVVLRNRHLARMEAEQKRERFVEEHAEEGPGESERVMRALCSEHSLRGSHGPAWDGVPLAPALERLATMLDEGLTDDERRLLAWLSHYVPQRRIAEWLGISYAAVTQRTWRLRERLRATAMRYAVGLEPGERGELRTFFQRSNVRYDDALSTGLGESRSSRSRVAENSKLEHNPEPEHQPRRRR